MEFHEGYPAAPLIRPLPIPGAKMWLHHGMKKPEAVIEGIPAAPPITPLPIPSAMKWLHNGKTVRNFTLSV